jgi:hypothetical protein
MRPVLITISISVVLLTGCQSAPTEPTEEEKSVAQAKLDQMMAAKQRQAEFAENQRRIEAERAERKQAEAMRPHYSPVRLAAAAKPRTWAHITVPDLNVDAVFNSSWKDGHLNYRVALLAQRASIDTFLHQHQSYSVNFANQAGQIIFQFPLSPDDFEWAPANFNGGIPTSQTSGQVEMDLETYEQAVQWNLTWQN